MKAQIPFPLRTFILSALFFLALNTNAQDPFHIIPKPAQILVTGDSFHFHKDLRILYDSNTGESTARYYVIQLYKLTGVQFQMQFTQPTPESNAISLHYDSSYAEEEYEIKMSQHQIRVTGNHKGLFYGVQTLLQMLPTEEALLHKADFKLPCVHISDQPAFAYRGVHLDVARHFFSAAEILNFIDLLAFHKINTFHWHLTDDQGWRIEIKEYPRLTQIGSKRNGTILGRYPGTGNSNQQYGGYYTREEIKKIIAYAKERCIEIIPEIEMPGHSSAAIAAYPHLSCFPNRPTTIPFGTLSKKSIAEQKKGRIKLVQETWGVFEDVLCPGKESTFLFLEQVLKEVASLFPSPYIHIGGDECPKTSWSNCSSCRKRMLEGGLKNPTALQSYFIHRIERIVNRLGKNIIGWDEILEGGLAPNARVMSWRGEQGGIAAARQGHYVIMSPSQPLYLDHTQSKYEDSLVIGGYNPLEAIYQYNPIAKELDTVSSRYILGAQANIWTEYITNTNKLEYMALPRLSAVSEMLWTNHSNKNRMDFERRLPYQLKRYQIKNLNFSNSFFELNNQIRPSDEPGTLLWQLSGRTDQDQIHLIQKLPHSNKVDSFEYRFTMQRTINQTAGYTAYLESGAGAFQGPILKMDFLFSKSTGRSIRLLTPTSPVYQGDGAFTLINGICNTKGLIRSHELLGFTDSACEVILDFGIQTNIESIVLHTFELKYRNFLFPYGLSVWYSDNDSVYTQTATKTRRIENHKLYFDFMQPVHARYLKLKILKDNPALLQTKNKRSKLFFLSEIEVR
ncbi:MAG: beta-N-acetylhexosaminidase [Lacibacter sp.]